jgi:hypothetical protein
MLAAALGAPATADRRLLDDLEAMTGDYGRMYWSLRPAALWPTMVAHVAVARRLHATARPAQQAQAGRIASEAATLLGMLAHRLDRHLDSSMYLHLAAELAALADDGPRRAHALVALRAAYAPVTGAGLRIDPPRALALTNEAVEVAGTAAPPLLLTWLHACCAEDHAALGHATGAEQEMAAAEAALAQAPSGSGGFFGHWDRPRLAGFLGSSALLLKQPGVAIDVLEASPPKRARTSSRRTPRCVPTWPRATHSRAILTTPAASFSRSWSWRPAPECRTGPDGCSGRVIGTSPSGRTPRSFASLTTI